MVLVCLTGQQITRPEPHREENEKQETRNADELKATVKETWASIPVQQSHKLITSMCNGCMPVRAVCKPHSSDLKMRLL